MADKIMTMSDSCSKFLTHLSFRNAKNVFHIIFFALISATIDLSTGYSAETQKPEISETSPVLFPSSYVGILVNQNHPYSFGNNDYSNGGPSWGAEYRFFYKDHWTLAITGSFKQLDDAEKVSVPVFSLSQETLRIFRLYHPWYFATGARLQYFVPVRQIMLPYERDQTRSIDNGAALTVATIWKSSEKTAMIFSVNRWRSLSTSRKQGIEISIAALFTVR